MVTITPVNDAPVISSTPPPTATEAALYTYSATRTDPDGPSQSWSLLAGHTCGGAINAATGVLTFTPTGPVPLPACVLSIQVCDLGTPNLCATQTATITITPTNSPPVFTSTGPTTATEDILYTYAATATDADGVGLTWSLAPTNTCGGTINSVTGVYTFLPVGPTPPPTCTAVLRVCDNGGACATQSTVVTITPVNDAPVITSSVPPTMVVGTPYVYNAVHSDPDGPGQTWSLLLTHTCGGSINPSSGVLTFTPTALLPLCVVSIQVCDGGTPNLCGTQTATVSQLLACGNGTVNAGEVCDDGNQTNGDGCENNCLLSDDEPCVDDDECASGQCDQPGSGTCEPANVCGNGTVETGETCDDGNTVGGDGCEATCSITVVCGNGIVQGSESCDDGNLTNGDGCESTCRLTDGEMCTMPGQCDSGICDAGVCEPANSCGNGVLEAGEICDDGNTTNGDGCEASCRLTDGEECMMNDQCDSGQCDTTTNPGICEPAVGCGNGLRQAGEGCDDGNTTSGDGCSATCNVEDGFPAIRRRPATSTIPAARAVCVTRRVVSPACANRRSAAVTASSRAQRSATTAI